MSNFVPIEIKEIQKDPEFDEKIILLYNELRKNFVEVLKEREDLKKENDKIKEENISLKNKIKDLKKENDKKAEKIWKMSGYGYMGGN